MSSNNSGIEILILMAGSNRAGQEVLVKNLIQEFRKRGISSCLITLFKGSLFNDLAGFYPKGFKPTSDKGLFQVLLIIVRVFYQIIRMKPAQIHIHGLGFERLLPVIYYLSPSSKISIIVHNNVNNESSPYLQRASHIVRNMSYVSNFVYITDKVRLNFEKHIGTPLCKSYVISNGIEIPEQEYEYTSMAHKSSLKLCQVGRLNEQKNQSLALNVIAELRQKGYDVTLDIYGEGPLKNRIMKEINELSLRRHVFLKGVISNIKERFLEYDALLFTSRYEGFPITLIEACMIGVPVFALPCPGISDLFEENACSGIYISTEYSQSSMSSMLENAFINGISYNQVAELRDEFRSVYNIELIADNYLVSLG